MKHYYTPQSTVSDKVNQILTLAIAFYDRAQNSWQQQYQGHQKSNRSLHNPNNVQAKSVFVKQTKQQQQQINVSANKLFHKP